MNKITYAILLALGTMHASANTISGTVTDQSGNPVTEGQISVEGTNLVTPIMQDGSFTISGLRLGEVELHVIHPPIFMNIQNLMSLQLA